MGMIRTSSAMLGALALMGFASCSSSSDNPAPTTNTDAGGDTSVGGSGGGGGGTAGGAGAGGTTASGGTAGASAGTAGAAGTTDGGGDTDGGNILSADLANGAIQAYGQAALANDSLTSANADGAVGVILYTSYLTLDSAVAAGACAKGDGGVTVKGGDGQTRTLDGAGMCAGAAATITGSNFASLVFAAGAALIGAFCYELPSMPADGPAAEAEFDKVFGSAARHGLSFDQTKTVDPKFDAGLSRKAFYGTKVQTFNSVKFAAGSIDATLFVGVLSVENKVHACHLSAVGTFVAKL